MRSSVSCSVALAAVAGANVAALAEPAAELATGLEYQEGDYGTGARIETATIRNTVRVQSGRAQLYVSLPWHRVEGPANVAGGGGLLGPILTVPGRPAGRMTRQGIGDLRVGIGYTLAAPAGIELTLLGETKLPTASASRGLGTGETDLAVGGEAGRSIGPLTLFAGVSYTMPGDPDGSRLRNIVSGRGGAAIRIAPGIRGHISYGQARGLSPFIENERLLSTGVDARLTDRLSLGISSGVGLTASSPDLGAAVRLGWRIF